MARPFPLVDPDANDDAGDLAVLDLDVRYPLARQAVTGVARPTADLRPAPRALHARLGRRLGRADPDPTRRAIPQPGGLDRRDLLAALEEHPHPTGVRVAQPRAEVVRPDRGLGRLPERRLHLRLGRAQP